MAKLETGMKIPNFRYDTPYLPQNSFAELAKGEPLFLVFLANLGHPVTRAVLGEYAATYAELQGCRLACVVRSRPETIAAALPKGSLPFTLICDAEGVLYEHFEIPQEKNILFYGSLQAMQILRQAQKKGYRPQKGAAQQLPLTLLVTGGREAAFVHYGKSLTDLPEDCEAMNRILEKLDAAAEKSAVAAQRRLEKAQVKKEQVIEEYTGTEPQETEPQTAERAAAAENPAEPDPFAAVLAKIKADTAAAAAAENSAPAAENPVPTAVSHSAAKNFAAPGESTAPAESPAAAASAVSNAAGANSVTANPASRPAAPVTLADPATPAVEPEYHERATDIVDDNGKAFTIASFFGGAGD